MTELVDMLVEIEQNINSKVYSPELADELRVRLVRANTILKRIVEENADALRNLGMAEEATACEEGGAFLEKFIANLLLRVRAKGEQCH